MEERKVLRTVYFPPKLDELIRVISFRQSKSKSELISELVEEALTARGITDVNQYINSVNTATASDSKTVGSRRGAVLRSK